MAQNSIRERILENIRQTVEETDVFKTVLRVFTKDIDSFAETQFPVAVIEGGLPDPSPHFSKTKTGGIPAQFKSMLPVWIYVFAKENINPDSVISDLSDELWKGLYADPKRGGLALATVIQPETNVMILPPYVRFGFKCDVYYIHDTKTL